MRLKIKNLVCILILFLFLAQNNLVWCAEKIDERYITNEPYIFYGERTFAVGFLEIPKEGDWGTPVPEIGGEKIFDFLITDSPLTFAGRYAKMLTKEKDIIAENFVGKYCFFTGYLKSYYIQRLIKENPHIKWLRNISLAHITVFEIEQIIPVENSDGVLSIEIPETLAEEFEISVTVKNILQRQLVGAKLQVNVTAGSLRIINGDTYDTKLIKDKYEAGESKVYNFRIQTRRPQPFDKTELEISVSFAGYGEEDSMVKPKIFPLYARKTYKYRLQWMRIQED